MLKTLFSGVVSVAMRSLEGELQGMSFAVDAKGALLLSFHPLDNLLRFTSG